MVDRFNQFEADDRELRFPDAGPPWLGARIWDPPILIQAKAGYAKLQ